MDNKPTPRAEFISGLAWIVLGSAIAYGSWAMDRLENLKIDPMTVPGLVPGILGGVIALCGIVLVWRAARAARPPAAAPDAAPRESLFNWRVGLSIALCLGFGLGTVGRGIPFWAGAAAFLFVYILIFELAERRGRRAHARAAFLAAAVGIGASAVITFIFQEFFLVRLP